MLTDSAVAVLNIEPLDDDKIRQYIQQRVETLHGDQEALSPRDILSFVMRTYDLKDLVTRPMLLKLIIDTVIRGGIDVADKTVIFGPSNLYEIYTTLSLDLDWDKGPVRRAVLTREQRLGLAHGMALSMHERQVLDVDLADAVTYVAASAELTTWQGTESPSLAEITTDFLTCSFLTIDSQMRCRFVHKSFREFFVAQVIKNDLVLSNPLLHEPLEWEILYFLGGFGPSEPRIVDTLWSLFLRADSSDRALRRNLLCAYLYSASRHVGREVKATAISNVSFGALEFLRTKHHGVSWIGCNIETLKLYDPVWRATAWESSEFGDIDIVAGGSVELNAASTTVKSISLSDGALRLSLNGGMVGSLRSQRARLSVSNRGAAVDHVAATMSEVALSAESPLEKYGQISAIDSILFLGTSHAASPGYFDGKGVSAERSMVVVGPHVLSDESSLMSCLIVCPFGHSVTSLKADDRSVFMYEGRMARSALNTSSGVFGGAVDSLAVADLARSPAWGIVVSNALFSDTQLTSNDRTVKVGRLVVAREEWYRSALTDGPLEALAQAGAIKTSGLDPYSVRILAAQIGAMLRGLRATYEGLLLRSKDYKRR